MPIDFPVGTDLDDTVTVLQLRAQWTLGSQARGESSWSFLFLRFDPIDQQDILWTLWDTNLRSIFVERRPTTWVLNQVIVEDRWPQHKPPLFIPLDQAGGGGSADSCPGQFGPVFSWRSSLAGRSNRGRTYWGPIMRDDLEGDFVSDACSDNLEAFSTAMISTFMEGPVTENQPRFVIVSRQHDGVPISPGRWVFVTDVRTVRVLGTQRRRLQWWNL